MLLTEHTYHIGLRHNLFHIVRYGKLASSSTDWDPLPAEAFRYCFKHNIIHPARALCSRCGLKIVNPNGSTATLMGVRRPNPALVALYADSYFLLDPVHIPEDFIPRPQLEIPIAEYRKYID